MADDPCSCDIPHIGRTGAGHYTDLRWENEGMVISGDMAMAMGNYFFMKPDGTEVKVEYTFGIGQVEDGAPKTG